ncbi:multiubiquitin domain-containing protein [Methylophilus flavus]|uniref:Multiubiquitin domain-containing protein n=1 Tax=Methylophilus flavus TaxID=640084 RepID=A0ABW3PBT4_9PROT
MAQDSKTVTIIVEGTPHQWPFGTKISYAQVVTLEVPTYPQHPEITYSVTFSNADPNRPEGILVAGSSVSVREGMVFNVSETGQS